MRARVRQERGVHSPVSNPSHVVEPKSAADSGQSRSAMEVTKNAGQEALPPWPALVAATIPVGSAVFSPREDASFTGEEDWTEPARGKLVVLDTPDGLYSPKELADTVSNCKSGALIGHVDTEEARAAFVGLNVFKVAGAPDRLFAATYELPVASWLERIAPPLDELEKSASMPVKLIKAEDVVDERIVYGIVLEPDGVDAQNDTVSPEEIRAAAHKFMQDYGNVGLQHQTFINGKARILESYIAPADFDVGDQHVKKGTWLMSMRVLDDDIWEAVKSGLITGFSIGGTAIRVPTAVA